eukprot:2108029-Rhodomonas_salina.2
MASSVDVVRISSVAHELWPVLSGAGQQPACGEGGAEGSVGAAGGREQVQHLHSPGVRELQDERRNGTHLGAGCGCSGQGAGVTPRPRNAQSVLSLWRKRQARTIQRQTEVWGWWIVRSEA